MKSYNQRFSITLSGRLMVLMLTLFACIQNAHGQKQSNPLYVAQEQKGVNPLHETAHVAQQAHDVDSDDGLLRVEGSVHTVADASTRASSVKPIRMTLALHVSTAGDDPVVRKRPGRTKYSNVTLEKHTSDTAPTKAQDYNSSRSNSRASHVSDGALEHTDDWIAARATEQQTSSSNATAQAASTAKYVDKSSTKSHVSDGSLEHTDDWIAARAAATGDAPVEVMLVATLDLHVPTDVHSGKLTGVRQHSPTRTSRPIDAATPYIYDAATPYIYKASVDANGAFVFEEVAPGAYQVRVLTQDGYEFRGHVTVLK